MMGAMFRSLRLVNYRLLFFGALVSNVGHWMQATAMSWVVLTQLTDNDAAAMGIALALQFGPPLLLVGVSGLAADRFDRRRLLLITQAALFASAAAIGILMLAGVMQLWIMYGFCLLLGCIAAFDNPARQAFVSDVVPRGDAPNAIALNSASFNVARLIGPAVAGIAIIVIGSGWVFLANAVSYVGMILALMLMRREELLPRVRPVGVQRFTDGLRYLGQRPDLLVLFAMVFLLGAFGMNFQIFASTMTLEFGLDADAYGLLTSVLAIGALTGSLAAARRDKASMHWVVIAAFVFGTAMLLSAFAPGYWWYAATCAVVGFGTVTMLTTANGYVQTTTNPSLRGRILAIYLAMLMGGTFLGAPVVGWVAQTFGPRAAIILGGASGIVGGAIGLARWLATRREPQLDTAALRIIQPTPDEIVG